MSYSGVKCLHPRRIFRDGEYKTVRCGHCEHCLQVRSSHLKTLCDFESSTSKQVFFLTLTYAEEYLPLCRVFESSINYYPDQRKHISYYDVYNLTSRLACDYVDVEDSYMGSFRMVRRDFIALWRKSALSYKKVWRPKNVMPYLHPADFQRFLKRLRYYLSTYNKQNNETITLRYYCLGEYSPRRFRPHWHILLFFNKKVSSSVLASYISKSWKYGSYDFSLVSNNAADYVTNYSTGSNMLSVFHGLPTTKPRILHSRYLGGQIFDSIQTEYGEFNCPIEQQRFNFPSEISFVRSGRVEPVWIFGTLANRRLPKCPRYSSMSHGLRCLSYSLYPFALRYYPKQSSVSAYAKLILDDVINKVRVPEYYDLYNFFRNLYNQHPLGDIGTILFSPESLYSCIYTTLLCSRRFYYVNKLDYSVPLSVVSYKLKQLDHIYSYYELQSLKDFYSSQSDVALTEPFTNYSSCFYDNYDPSNCKNSFTYLKSCSSRVELFHSKRKHKELNDLNDRFCYSKTNINYLNTLLNQ